ncbi:MAG: flagellin, partial [Selenomonas sp.]|nr:flagellin [Selenomonas sp.]
MAKINSASTTNLLGQLQGNDKEMGRNLLKLATGQKLNNSGDDTSGFTISERMRVRLRALERAGENTQTGYNMIDTASRAVQEQLNLMRTIKEKVIDAHNDSNTDEDRLIIQKEITHAFQEIQDIAYETTYNGKRLLSGGDYVKASVFAWNKLDEAVKVEGSDKLQMIPDKYATLDGMEGAFDIFSLWTTNESSDGGKHGLVNEAPWEVKTEDLNNSDKAFVEYTFNGFANAAAMDGYGVRVSVYGDGDDNYSYKNYVFSRNTGDTFASGFDKIDISGANSVADVVNKLSARINSDFSSYVTASASSNTVKMVSKANSAWSNSNSIYGSGASGSTTSGVNRSAAVNSNALFGTFSGGRNQSGRQGDADGSFMPAASASATVSNLSSAPSDSGFTINVAGGNSKIYIRLADGSSGPSYNNSDGTYTIGKNASFNNATLQYSGIKVSMSNGTMTITMPPGAAYNSSTFTDGIASDSAQTTSSGKAVTAVQDQNLSANRHAPTIDPSKYILDVSSYKGNNDSDALETFIQSLTGITDNYFTTASFRSYRRS